SPRIRRPKHSSEHRRKCKNHFAPPGPPAPPAGGPIHSSARTPRCQAARGAAVWTRATGWGRVGSLRLLLRIFWYRPLTRPHRDRSTFTRKKVDQQLRSRQDALGHIRERCEPEEAEDIRHRPQHIGGDLAGIERAVRSAETARRRSKREA